MGATEADARVAALRRPAPQLGRRLVVVDHSAVAVADVDADRQEVQEATLNVLRVFAQEGPQRRRRCRSEEHTSELQSLMRISYAVFCLKKKKKTIKRNTKHEQRKQ